MGRTGNNDCASEPPPILSYARQKNAETQRRHDNHIFLTDIFASGFKKRRLCYIIYYLVSVAFASGGGNAELGAPA